MANVAGCYCPFRASHIAGALSPCNDECALYLKSSKLPPQKSCALAVIAIHSLQKIVTSQSRGISDEQTEEKPSSPREQ